ncbi:MAG: metal-dependent phosphohydrolase, partial [Flavobacterium sp.]
MTSNDLYQEEIKLRLEKSKIYQELRQKSINDEDSGAAALLVTVDKAVSYCYQRSKLVLKHMGEFTLHDGEHLFRVLRLIDYIVPDDSISRLSSPELGLLILTAFFHDVGMAPSESEVKAWLGIWENEIPSPQEMIEHQKYTRFKAGKQIQVAEIAHLRIQEKFSQADIVERYLVTEFIRTTHADRATDIIEKDWNGLIKYKDVDLTSELAVLCNSHNEDGMKLLDLQSSIIAGPNLHICLPFIGVLLRLADLLDFDGNRTPKVLFAHIGVKDPVSLKEWEKHRAVEAWSISPSKIIYNATCNHPAIEYSIREFCDYIDYELVSCASILNNLHDSIRNPFPSYYKINLPNKVDRSQIGPKKDVKGRPVYLYRDTKFTLNKEQIIDILMGTKLYGQPSVALRELVQNSIDACKLRAKMEENWGNSSYIPEIIIRFSKEGIRTYLEVNDNGVGMDQYIIDKFYSKVGSSYYSSSDFLELKSTLKSTFIPTSRFGIGILSCFMISDSIEVETKRIYEAHESSPPLNISIVGQESIFYIKSGTRKT